MSLVENSSPPNFLQSPAEKDGRPSFGSGILRGFPCPQCGRVADGCFATEVADGFHLFCQRVPSGWTTRSGRCLHRLHGAKADAFRQALAASPQRRAITSDDQRAKLAKQAILFFGRGSEARARLAEQLEVSVDALRRLGVGFTHGFDRFDQTGCYTAPELDARGDIIGLHLRKPLGFKYQADGSQRGLVYDPATWQDGRFPLFIVEGLSDTAALLTMGIPSVVGRPSNIGGVDELAVLLESVPDNRLVIFIGEDDRLKAGHPRALVDHNPECPGCLVCWPGLAGAVYSAKSLSTLANRTVAWVLPPDGKKDSRGWLNAQLDRTRLSDRFWEQLQPYLTMSTRPVPLPVVDIPKDTRPAVELNTYRQQMGAARQDLRVGHVYLDRSETGAGKTRANLQAALRWAAAGEKSLILLPTHSNGREALVELSRYDVVAARYPQRTTPQAAQAACEIGKDHDPVNCWNPMADQAEQLGLPILKTACIGCPQQELCSASGYLRQLRDASAATISIATHQRGGHQGLTELARHRSLVILEETPWPVLRPTTPLDLNDVVRASLLIRRLLEDPDELDRFADHDEERDFRQSAIRDWLAAALPVLQALPETLHAADSLACVRPVGSIPRGLERHLWVAMRRLKLESGGWRGMLGTLAGDGVTTILVQTCWSKGAVDFQTTDRSMVTTWKQVVPSHAAMIISDATSHVDELETLLRTPIHDITPRGKVPLQHRATQIPNWDITRRASDKKVTSILRGLLAEQPALRRHGVIGHSVHYATLQRLAAETEQISKIAYFGSGEERSSNAWSVGDERCDRLLVIGTPRPGPDAVRAELVRRGAWEAAAELEPAWREYAWRGRDEFGQPAQRLVKTKGYRNPEWQTTYTSLCRSNLVQAVGRGRGILEHGIPVVVVSREPIGLPLRDGERPWMNPHQAAALEAVRRLAQPKVSATNPNKYLLGKPAETRPVKTGAVADDLRDHHPADPKLSDVPIRTVHSWLSQLEKLGCLVRLGNRGWMPAIPFEATSTASDGLTTSDQDSAISRASTDPSETSMVSMAAERSSVR